MGESRKASAERRGKEEEHRARPPRPQKSGRQGTGPEWTGEGDSSLERGQRASAPSEGGGSQWSDEGVRAPKGHREY